MGHRGNDCIGFNNSAEHSNNNLNITPSLCYDHSSHHYESCFYLSRDHCLHFYLRFTITTEKCYLRYQSSNKVLLETSQSLPSVTTYLKPLYFCSRLLAMILLAPWMIFLAWHKSSLDSLIIERDTKDYPWSLYWDPLKPILVSKYSNSPVMFTLNSYWN